jgi:hypothetical protein
LEVYVKLPFGIWDYVFSSIWLGTAVMFFIQARSAYADISRVLARYPTSIPPEFNVQIGHVRFQDVINGLITSYNANVEALQASIQGSASLAFKLNFLSGCLAVIGLVAQLGQAWRGTGT